jgi:hypothetical protein
MYVYADTTNKIQSPLECQSVPFSQVKTYYFINENPLATYWIKINIIDTSGSNYHWFFISYNYSVDSLDVFLVENHQITLSKSYRIKRAKLSEQEVTNKNFTIHLPLPKNKPVELYIKLRNNQSFQYGFAIREHKEYFSASIYEYFLFGIFYGGMIIITLYHFILFISLRDSSYIFYVVYILVQGIYMCYRDATALVFIFPESTYLIRPTYNVVMFCLSISVLLYTRSFLQLHKYKLFNSVILVFIIIRFFLYHFFPDYSIQLMIVDILPIFVSIAFSIVSLIQKNKTAILILVGLVISALGYTINLLWHASVMSGTSEIFYLLYYTIMAEALILAFANAYRIRHLRQEAFLKIELEKKVTEATSKIKEQEERIRQKSDELDVFLYRASHDIKGPLLSIEGLSAVGQMDEKNKNAYFQHIAATSARLQEILNAILNLAKSNRKALSYEPVPLKSLFDICMNEHLVAYPGFNEMIFSIDIPDDFVAVTDKYLMLSIIQNLMENSIKYRDKGKTTHSLRVSLVEYKNLYDLIFEDNGIGISEGSLKKIFQMFYKAHDTSISGSGLGLYIVKQNVERLGGKIHVESEENKFTRIRISFLKHIPADVF